MTGEDDRDSRSAKTVLGRGPFVRRTVLLHAAMLRGLVIVTATTTRGRTTLLSLDVGVGSITAKRDAVSDSEELDRSRNDGVKTLTIRQSHVPRTFACRAHR